MFNKEEYWANRKAGKRGQGEYLKPTLIEGSGKAQLFKVGDKEIFVPRVQRRKFVRALYRDVTKGRININQLMKERLDRDRTEQGQGV